MKKFKFLVTYGLKKRLKTKAFLIANIVIALLMIAIANLPLIIGLFTAGEEQIENINIQIINETEKPELISDLTLVFNEPFEQNFYLISELDITQLDLDEFWGDEKRDIIIHFTGEIESPDIKFYNKNQDFNMYLMAVIEKQIVYYQVGDFQRPVFETVLPPDFEQGIDAEVATILGNLVGLPVFFLIITATQFVGVDIIEEKSTKAIDTIIASVPAKTHFLAKISAAILFVMLQGFLTVIYGLIGFLISRSFSDSVGEGGIGELASDFFSVVAQTMPNWPIFLFLTLLFMVVGTLFYLVLAALFSSMAVNQEDYQQLHTPMMLLLLAGLYIGMFAPIAGGADFMKVMAFVPFFAPMLAPIVLITGAMTVLEAFIALFVSIVFLVVAMYLVAPIYKIAILSYDQANVFKRTYGYFKKAFVKNGKKKSKEE